MNPPIRIGTRGSRLALWQANETARLLEGEGWPVEIVTVTTSGDRRTDVSLASIGGKGLFIKELEEALDRDAIDIAVHSLKDVPSIIPARFAIAGFLERADPRDAWVHPRGLPIAELPDGAVIGTSSPRRRTQLRSLHPGLVVRDIRGNVETRIGKARDGDYDGLILASAGMKRLGFDTEITSLFDLDAMVPAAGQGIIGIECLESNARAREAAESITHEKSRLAASCERGVLQRFGERLDCHSAIAVHAEPGEDVITMHAFVSDDDGSHAIRTKRSGANADELIAVVYDDLVAQGAETLLWP
jgi:hydroxymethylbilane synthase